MNSIKIANWDRWQTYRSDRGQPPWIKIHRRLMRNVEWVSLTDAERGQLVAMWLLAADHDGVIPASSEVIQKLCYMTKTPNLNKFTDLGFIENGWRQHGVNMASDGGQHDALEKTRRRLEEEEEKKQMYGQNFAIFWNLYPKKKKKGDAQKAWNKLKPGPELVKEILNKIQEGKSSDDWLKESGKYIPYPASWLNAKGWHDEFKETDNRFSEITRKNIETLKNWEPPT